MQPTPLLSDAVAPAPGPPSAPASPTSLRPLVIACGALATDLRAVLVANGLADAVEVTYLPANHHMNPERIVPGIRPLLEAATAAGRFVFVAYADCGTGGLLDALIEEFPGVLRLPGAHCYELFAGRELFAELQEAELGTFYLTDFLAKHFDALVWSGLGLDRSPQLRDMYFGNYTRVLLLAQTDDPQVNARAEAAAQRLGLTFERVVVGRSELSDIVKVSIARTRMHAADNRAGALL